MKRLICTLTAMGLLVFAGALIPTSGAADGPEPIGKIMSKLHKGKKAPMAVLKTQLKSASPEWPVVQKEAETYAKYSADMPKNDPPKGEASSWAKLAKAYAGNAKALEEAAKKEDLAASKAAFGKIGSSCKECHDKHKED
ncbi:Cytochrome C' [Aquisphaera giovannonii]|uniref:Cytochrome C n=1 Tax=Aquisphaera giovannonii TaxID=406548 RepID=A0A5B9VY46_9BACT|nr:cytochrome c [Aquisphaera giovannonii]QEH32831.1 Cytochrome C' [Aquisphaera giovannonii]